jgi:hypothetical protein
MVVHVAGPMVTHNSKKVYLNVCVAGPMDAHDNQTDPYVRGTECNVGLIKFN